MPSFRRRASVIDDDHVDQPKQDPDRSADAADALALAEEAEAEAAEADAIAAAARARARAIRLRRQAAAELEARATDVDAKAADVESEATEVTDVESDGKEDVADEPSEDEPVRERRRWGLVLKVVAATLASLCTIALIAVSVIMVKHHRDQAAEQQRSAEYAAAARQSAVTLMSLDFNKAKEDVQRIIDNSTGQFRDDFKNQADDFIKVAQDSKVITEVTVNATG
ncbi:MAG: Mce-associated rane protein, partial [Mycobacterium sp.]|nr:Mce-associated rane protein [Mycobacterium sp.]